MLPHCFLYQSVYNLLVSHWLQNEICCKDNVNQLKNQTIRYFFAFQREYNTITVVVLCNGTTKLQLLQRVLCRIFPFLQSTAAITT